jgi:hypothetical protein
MPIETFNFIHDLVPTNPIHTDPLSAADAHLRGIKQTLQNTFPNLAGTVAATDVALSAAGAAFITPGTLAIDANGTLASGILQIEGITTGSDVLIVNTGTASGAPGLAIQMTQGTTTTVPLTLTSTGSLVALAAVSAPSIQQAGNALLPAGVICMWSGAISAVPAGWHLCDGTNGTPNLLDRFVVAAGASLGVGAFGGSTTSTAVTSTAGSHNHTGAVAPSGGFSVVLGTDAQGNHSHGGSDQGHALTVDELPPHTHTYNVISDGGSGTSAGGRGGPFAGTQTTNSTGSGFTHIHGISADGTHSHNVGFSALDHVHGIGLDGSHSHSASVNITPPYYALAMIMKL